PVSPVRRGSAVRSVRSLPAGELRAQGGQLLVRGQRTAGRLGLLGLLGGRADRRGGLRRVVGRGGDRGLLGGGATLLDLLGVQPVATLGLRVAVLPLLALLLEALEPLVGLGVEALGEDVVAGLVVAVGHAVLGRVEVLREVLVRLLQGERDATTVEV